LNSTILQLIFIGFGGAVGSMARYSVALIWRSGSPIGTLVVNVIGSFILGFLVSSPFILGELKPHWRLMVTVGFCGGFTTFSTFSVQTMEMIQTGRWMMVGINITTNVGFCLLLSFFGFWVGKTLFSSV